MTLNGSYSNHPEPVDPILIGNLLYLKGRRLVGFYVRVYNKPGVFADIAAIFKKYGVNLWNIVFGARVGIGEVGTGFIVADFTETSVEPSDVRRELEKLDSVDYVELVKPQFPQILADTHHFPIVDDAGSRYIMISEEAQKAIVIRIRERFGPTGNAFLYYQGVTVGETFKDHCVSMGITDLRRALELLLIYTLTTGRYRGEIVEYSYGDPLREDRIVIRLHHNWECVIARRHGIREPSSFYERGVVAGLVQAFTDRSVSVEETRCLCKGDPYCEFTITFHS